MTINNKMKEIMKEVKEIEKEHKEYLDLLCYCRDILIKYDYALDDADMKNKKMQRAYDILMDTRHQAEVREMGAIE
jgi:hypothetical protein